MLNRVVVLGRLTKDPELRKTNSDVSFATFSLAVDNPVKEADGTRGTLFIDCRIFGAQSESLVKYTSKGSKVAVDGAINQRNFMRQDGTKGKAIEIYVDSVTFLDPKPQTNEDINPELLKQIEEEASGNVKTAAQVEDEDYDGPYDSAGSLDGEEYVDAKGQKQKLKAVPPTEPVAKFDPITGKPLTPKGKK